ncbi:MULTISPECIES: hypothetical protein [Streptomyces]|uniref:hypothetical protein n=1 Tax=Streptomyces TaxID=1883 RepID=UPI000A366947|nr:MULTISPECIES: hypothetical protein [Streptomyces]MDX3586231.1 hypothetical protein [Streptomyces europaeiscabiei]MDX3636223.1 hypothetical protein [Streptomyces europaeiscabiei]MDX3654199.1 hypothetical protein [Streptomyces europaeiscabiei]
MPPCLDVYVWVPQCTPSVFQAFIDRYVDAENPGDERLRAFMRTYVAGAPAEGDYRALAELGRGDGSGSAFSLYVRAREFYGAIITVAHDGAAVLGLSLDDPDNSPLTRETARHLLGRLCHEFSSPAGIAGVEVPPPQSRAEWEESWVELRTGVLPNVR